MKTFVSILSAFAATVVFAANSFAATHTFHVSLDGLQEVPPNASPAFGSATVLVDDVAHTATVDLSFSGLLGAQTAAHIHGPAAPGVNGPVLIGFPIGSFVGMVFPTTPTIESHMFSGLTYINVHSTVFPGGEIRGQLQAPVSVDGSSWGGIKNLYR
jgi:hypothetical protein